ncbi:MAG: 3-dehydroquinate synthase [Succiniclasticum sp.]|nr:3-dehydroquinate synthase [Succiniclasticum sp.]MDY6086919.1 3-dehydroquinate synthase [Succiniclasticum sp.]
MKEIQVALGEKSYWIKIAAGLLAAAGDEIRRVLPQTEKIAVITDSNVAPLYGERLRKSLEMAGFSVTVREFPAGEESKNLAVLGRLYEGLAAAGLTRSDAIVALGGGVTGDMAGLAAATYLRGIAFIQIPTSLLAAVDSSVGGKVAVDLPQGKNLVGAFYQPRLVLIDPELLYTLPPRFLHDGLAEVIKYGCIRNTGLFTRLEQLPGDAALLAQAEAIIATCCTIKARIVEQDEFDTGERMLLNFGHTLGHAVEKAFHYDTYSHGEAVGLGMVLLTSQAEKLGLTDPGTAAKIAALLQKFSLPVEITLPREEFIKTIALDKKKRGSQLTLVLIKDIGEGYLHTIENRDLPNYLP